MTKSVNAHAILALLSLSLAGSAGAQLFGEKQSPAERRKEIDDSRSKILEDLFAKNPELKEKVKKAPGYGTFDALNVNLLVLSTARGTGVVVGNVTNEQTYMKLTSIGGGIGAGLKDLRALIIFNDHKTLQNFVNSGWHFGAGHDQRCEVFQGQGPELIRRNRVLERQPPPNWRVGDTLRWQEACQRGHRERLSMHCCRLVVAETDSATIPFTVPLLLDSGLYRVVLPP